MSKKVILLSSHQEVVRLEADDIKNVCCMAGNPSALDLLKVIDINNTIYWCDELEYENAVEDNNSTVQYIDKSEVIAEIERRIDEEVRYDKNGNFASWAAENYDSILNSIRDFIDTLEVREVDLEKEFDKYAEKWIFDDESEVIMAKHFFELGIKTQKGE